MANELIEMGEIGDAQEVLDTVVVNLSQARKALKQAYLIGTKGEGGILSPEDKMLFRQILRDTTKVSRYFSGKAYPELRKKRFHKGRKSAIM